METSIFIAKIFGPICLVIALGIVFNRENYRSIMKGFFQSAAVPFFSGILSLVVGLIIVLTHNVWELDWPVLITVFGWGGLLKGTWLIVFPKSIEKLTQACMKNDALIGFQSIWVLVVGIYFTYFGYFVG